MSVCQYDNKFIGRQNTEKISFVPAKIASKPFRPCGNRAGIFWNKGRKNCPYARKSLKAKKRGPERTSLFFFTAIYPFRAVCQKTNPVCAVGRP